MRTIPSVVLVAAEASGLLHRDAIPVPFPP